MTTPEPRPGTAGEPLPPGPPYTTPSAPSAGAPGVAPAPSAATPGAAPVPSAGAPGTAPGPVQPRPAAEPERHTGRTIGRTLAAALLVAVTVLLVLFVVFNTQRVDISLVFTDIEAPLVVALLVAAGLGALVAVLAGLLRRARRGR